jgi:hypothetical protein
VYDIFPILVQLDWNSKKGGCLAAIWAILELMYSEMAREPHLY